MFFVFQLSDFSIKINKILGGYRMQRLEYTSSDPTPADIPDSLVKYWHQRYRLFSKFDYGIKLDYGNIIVYDCS